MSSYRIAAKRFITITYRKKYTLFFGWGRISKPDSERKANTQAHGARACSAGVVGPAESGCREAPAEIADTGRNAGQRAGCAS